MNRVRICGEVLEKYEQIVELTDEELISFRNHLNYMKDKGEQAVDDYLGETHADTHPCDWEFNNWSAELIDDDGKTIESLDY